MKAKTNSVSVDYGKHNHGIEVNKSSISVRVDGNGLHTIVRYDGLVTLIGRPLAKRLFYAFSQSGEDYYTRRLRRGLKLVFFEN